jgi:Na+/H+-dicarboxylate symporter
MFAWAWSPGAGMGLTASDVVSSTPPNLFQSFVELIPTNAFHALAQGNMLQVIVLALIVGIALSRLNRERPAAVLMQGLDELDRLMLKLVSLIMMFVPIGVFALMARSTATLGVELLLPLLGYVLVLISALLFHALVSYSLLIKQLTGLSMLTLMRELKPLWLFSFSTASSAASIPVTLATCDRLRISPQLSRFTIPLGATLNMDGTAIMQGVATVFIANAYGIALLPMDYLMIIVTATLASIGTAAVPGAGLVMLTLVLTQAGLPIEGIALILGVDRLLDMLRTSVNVTGDVVVSYIVAYKTDFLDSSRENAVENSRV